MRGGARVPEIQGMSHCTSVNIKKKWKGICVGPCHNMHLTVSLSPTVAHMLLPATLLHIHVAKVAVVNPVETWHG